MHACKGNKNPRLNNKPTSYKLFAMAILYSIGQSSARAFFLVLCKFLMKLESNTA